MKDIALTLSPARKYVRQEDGYLYYASRASVRGEALHLYVKKSEAVEFGREDSLRGPGPARFLRDVTHSLRMVVQDQYSDTVIDFEATDVSWPVFDLFRDGRILLASRRTKSDDPANPDKNALIIDPVTGACRRFEAGDGISDLGVDERGRIWCGYCDEGVYGKFRLGRNGLNCFAETGEIAWYYPNVFAEDHISDCYALNVREEDAFAYFYTGFPLCHISSNFHCTYRSTKARGSNWFAISENLVVFGNQYDEPACSAHIFSLKPDSLSAPTPATLTYADGTPIRTTRIVARGSCIHVFDDSGWSTADISSLLARPA
jgi:hypothetical protein